jgi:hypothetical protein
MGLNQTAQNGHTATVSFLLEMGAEMNVLAEVGGLSF